MELERGTDCEARCRQRRNADLSVLASAAIRGAEPCGCAPEKRASVAPDAFVRGPPRAGLWRGALPSYNSTRRFGCRTLAFASLGLAGRTNASAPTEAFRLP